MRINIELVRKKDAAASIDVDYFAEEHKKSGYAALLGASRVEYVRIEGAVTQKNGFPAIDYAVTASFWADCARCGAEIKQKIEFDGGSYIAAESEDKEDGEEFYITETDGTLELDDFIAEFLGVRVPYRYLCSEDCKGLCQKCGRDLNTGDCGCPKTEKNPAFKILDDFFES